MATAHITVHFQIPLKQGGLTPRDQALVIIQGQFSAPRAARQTGPQVGVGLTCSLVVRGCLVPLELPSPGFNSASSLTPAQRARVLGENLLTL